MKEKEVGQTMTFQHGVPYVTVSEDKKQGNTDLKVGLDAKGEKTIAAKKRKAEKMAAKKAAAEEAAKAEANKQGGEA